MYLEILQKDTHETSTYCSHFTTLTYWLSRQRKRSTDTNRIRCADGKKIRAEVQAEYKAEQLKRENAKFNKVGINVNDGTITIDTNKTKDFFKQFSKKMEAKMKKISDDLQQGIIDSKEAGINIDNKHVNIDLNKTKTFLEDWTKKIQVFAHEFDNISKDLDNTNTHKGQ